MRKGWIWGTWTRKLARMKTDQTLGTWTRFLNARHFLSGKRNPFKEKFKFLTFAISQNATTNFQIFLIFRMFPTTRRFDPSADFCPSSSWTAKRSATLTSSSRPWPRSLRRRWTRGWATSRRTFNTRWSPWSKITSNGKKPF